MTGARNGTVRPVKRKTVRLAMAISGCARSGARAPLFRGCGTRLGVRGCAAGFPLFTSFSERFSAFGFIADEVVREHAAMRGPSRVNP